MINHWHIWYSLVLPICQFHVILCFLTIFHVGHNLWIIGGKTKNDKILLYSENSIVAAWNYYEVTYFIVLLTKKDVLTKWSNKKSCFGGCKLVFLNYYYSGTLFRTSEIGFRSWKISEKTPWNHQNHFFIEFFSWIIFLYFEIDTRSNLV